MGLTSEHFSNEELSCHGTTCGPNRTGCHVNGVQQSILDALEQFRALIAKAVIVDDAYRCPIHNAQVGGVSDSEHLLGIAADIRIDGMTGADLEAAALKCPLITAIGRSDEPPYIHIDTRHMTRGHARWCYNAHGAWVAWFPPPTA